MASKIIKSLAFVALASAGSLAMAQVSGGGVSGGGVSGGGISGVSGVSGGLAIDFAGSQVPGMNTKKDGGLASSIDEAMGGPESTAGTSEKSCDSGLKCKQ